jgi:hypothetical protein
VINKTLLAFLATLALSASAQASEPAAAVDPAFRGWIEDMKLSERGPFSRIRWFCRDGSVLPPKPYACNDHGGGYQHGEWSEQTLTLREKGYFVANILAGTDAAGFADRDDFPDRYAQLLIERFLIRADNGWILRRALFYRGAIQEEDERAAARALLLELAGRDEWIGFRYPALRTGVALLPHGENSASVQQVRQDSAALSDRDEGFKPLRAKIHGAPGPEDAAAVRRYAEGLDSERRVPYLALADEIDAVYQAAPLGDTLNELAARYTAAPWLQDQLRSGAARLGLANNPEQGFEVTAALLLELRDALPSVQAPSVRLELIALGLRLEVEHFKAAAALRQALPTLDRRTQARLLGSSLQAAYGCGLINERLLAAALGELSSLDADAVSLARYQAVLSYLGRAPGWGTQAMRMQFFESMQKLAQIEPLAMLFIQDQLRGSPLLFFAQALDGLSRDANRLAGVTHRLFGEDIGTGFNALNPGLARGVLHVEPDLSALASFRPDGIYVLPETVSDLPPVAGILTAGEGNPLSHVQLLARNLGIPNVTISAERVRDLIPHEGEDVVLAVSRSGLVEIAAWDDRWVEVFAADTGGAVLIRPDLEKLDLGVRRFVPLDELRAADSGRTVGPKAAKLGELRHHYPGHVSRGVAIPFGLFRQVALERQRPGHDGTVWDWMTATYAALEDLPEGSPERAAATEAFRAALYETILATPLDESFRAALKAALGEAFGSESPPGLFVRSDTNVEDLAGFTGAGLNLTLPNVVGFEALLAAIPRVWASPFTARAFGWRQSHMTDPEHVYTSILLLESVASDKSGVLVTQDIDTGDLGVVSVAVNEGLGGAVDGQAAESLRIDLETGAVRVLATATAPWRRVPGAAGGLEYLPVSGDVEVLKPAEIEQIIAFATGLPERFPPITDDEGNPAPADVEFGFVDGELRLFQLRPFLDSRSAAGSAYLLAMDARLGDAASIVVDMEARP